MPRVPEYDTLQVGASALPNAQVRGYEAPAIAGKDALAIGQGLSEGGAALTKVAIKQMELDNQALLDKQETLAREFILNFQMSNAKRVGEHASGMTQEFSEGFNKFTAEQLQGLPKHLQPVFERKVVDLAMGSLGRLSSYEAEQKHVARLGANEAKGKTLLDFAVNARDGEEFTKAAKDLDENILARADLMGVTDPTHIQRLKEEARSGVLGQRLVNLMNRQPDQALGYFRAVQDQIKDPNLRSRLESMIVKSDREHRVEVAIETEWDRRVHSAPETLATMRNWVTKQFSGDDQKAALQLYDQLKTSRDQAQEQQRRGRLDAAWTAVAKTNSLRSISAADKLWLQEHDPKGWLALVEKVQNAGSSRKTDPETFHQLSHLHATDPKKFATLDLRYYLPKLSESRYEYFETLQADANKPEKVADSASLQQQLAIAHNLMNLKNSDREAKGRFDMAVVAEIEAQKLHGPVDQDKRQKIIDQMMLKGEVLSGKWWQADRDTRFYEVYGTPDEKKWRADARADSIKEIPEADVQQIREALQRKGEPITDALIIEIYNRQHGY